MNSRKCCRPRQNPEYVTIPCFATARNNLTNPADMHNQDDPPNAQIINILSGVEVDSYFGCWLDINQPQQKFLPKSPPAGDFDGPWTTQHANHTLYSIHDAIVAAPHQCLIAEIRYDDAPVIPNATSAASDKLAQRNIAWIDGPNPGTQVSRRMTHPVEVRPTPAGALSADELMIFWGQTPQASQGQLYLPARARKSSRRDCYDPPLDRIVLRAASGPAVTRPRRGRRGLAWPGGLKR
jgi:hypothetical protein